MTCSVGKVAFGGRTTDATTVNTAALAATTFIATESRTVPVHALVAFARSNSLLVRVIAARRCSILRCAKVYLLDSVTWDTGSHLDSR